jgi:hypothetical protein
MKREMNRGGDKPWSSETQPLSRAGRKAADAVLTAATFKPTIDGTRLVRRYEVHGIVVTEYVDARTRTNGAVKRAFDAESVRGFDT